jgi:uncharacterized protein YdiU (UPF0061 family)
MAANSADFTLTFRRLCDAAAGPHHDAAVQSLFAEPAAYDLWAEEWRRRVAMEKVSASDRAAAMKWVNPMFVPRNHLVEGAIEAAVERQDLQPFNALMDVVVRPYEDRPDMLRYAQPARPEELVTATFCGT